jgi:putative Mg2+ transporter-C (MgtC) family protein
LFDQEQIFFIIRLVEAAFLGGLIGLERERNNQPAGLRTHIILCLGSALIMEVSILIAEGSPNYDPGRIAAQVVTGVGFLGAGAILRMGASVRGLTTAASIWTTAGIGLAVGAGYHTEAIAAVAILIVSLGLLKKLSRQLSGPRRFKLLEVILHQADEEEIFLELENILSKQRCSIREMDVRKEPDEDLMHIRIQMTAPRDFEPPHLIEALTRHSSVTRAEVR